MGQKTHPYGFRLGFVKPWKSRWYANGRDFPALLAEDEKLRKYLHARLDHAAVADIEIERKPTKIVVTIHTGRPGVVIGKRGAEVDKLRDELALLTDSEVSINVEEIKRPEVSAQLVANSIAHQLKQRIGFRRAMKRAMQAATGRERKASRSSVLDGWEAPRSLARKDTTRAACRCTRCARTSTTQSAWQRRPTAPSA